MFIWDFVMGDVMDQFLSWLYGKIVGFLGDFFAQMGEMGAALFDLSWTKEIVLFFSLLGWSLYVTGLVVALAECGIEYQSGRGNSVRDAALNAIKGFMAVSVFTVTPVELFRLAVNLQALLTADITGKNVTFNEMANDLINSFGLDMESALSGTANTGLGYITSPLLLLFIIIMIGYAVIKVFFANLKRGGILLIQIAVGSLYMFSVPRGYIDGFVQWMKQVIGLCLTTFLQSSMLTVGLLILKDNALLGLGMMLAATEVPRVAGAFGLETSTRANVMSAVYTAQAAVSTTRTISTMAAR